MPILNMAMGPITRGLDPSLWEDADLLIEAINRRMAPHRLADCFRPIIEDAILEIRDRDAWRSVDSSMPEIERLEGRVQGLEQDLSDQRMEHCEEIGRVRSKYSASLDAQSARHIAQIGVMEEQHRAEVQQLNQIIQEESNRVDQLNRQVGELGAEVRKLEAHRASVRGLFEDS